MHPKVRAVLDKGLHHEWTSKDVAELLGIGLRTAQNLFQSEHLRTSDYPTNPNTDGGMRRASGLSLLLYILKHAEELQEADVIAALKKALPLLTDSMLEGVIGAAKAIIQARQGMLVVLKEPSFAKASEAQGRRSAVNSQRSSSDQPELSFVADLTAADAA